MVACTRLHCRGLRLFERETTWLSRKFVKVSNDRMLLLTVMWKETMLADMFADSLRLGSECPRVGLYYDFDMLVDYMKPDGLIEHCKPLLALYKYFITHRSADADKAGKISVIGEYMTIEPFEEVVGLLTEHMRENGTAAVVSLVNAKALFDPYDPAHILVMAVVWLLVAALGTGLAKCIPLVWRWASRVDYVLINLPCRRCSRATPPPGPVVRDPLNGSSRWHPERAAPVAGDEVEAPSARDDAIERGRAIIHRDNYRRRSLQRSPASVGRSSSVPGAARRVAGNLWAAPVSDKVVEVEMGDMKGMGAKTNSCPENCLGCNFEDGLYQDAFTPGGVSVVCRRLVDVCTAGRLGSP